MMGFDDLDVVRIAEHARRFIQQLQREVHTHAHVGCKDHRDLPRVIADLGFLRFAEPCSADDDRLRVPGTDLQRLQTALGTREIDGDVEIVHAVAQRRLHDDAAGRPPEHRADVAAQRVRIGVLARRRDRHAGFSECRLQQRPAHAPGGA